MQRIILLAFIVMCLPVIVTAHSYWIETSGSGKINAPVTIKLIFGEYASGEIVRGKSLDKMKDINVYVQVLNQAKEKVVMLQTDSCWTGSFTPVVEGTYEITGINDTREVQDWTKHKLGVVRPVQYLKHFYQVGKNITNQSVSSFLDIKLVTTETNDFIIQVFKNKAFLPGSKVIFTQPDGTDIAIHTDSNGKLNFKPILPGLYIASIDWIDPVAGQFRGKDYQTVRHRLDLSFNNPAL